MDGVELEILWSNLIGIVAGTYSSIYISAALALDFGLRTDDLLERKLTKPEEIDGLP